MDSPEARVVSSLKRHLLEHGLGRGRVSGVLVDSHGSNLRSTERAALEPLARLDIGGAHADMIAYVGSRDSGEVVAIEVKHDLGDWSTGMGQATRYREGAHLAYFAAPALADDRRRGAVIDHGRRNDVGVLLARDGGWVEEVAPPDPRPRPGVLADTLALLAGVPLARQLQLNYPLNYLVVALVADECEPSELSMQLEKRMSLAEGSRKHARIGAEVLGLINVDGRPTRYGRDIADLLRAVSFRPDRAPSTRRRLQAVAPECAAVARIVLLRHPAVRVIVEALEGIPARPTLLELAKRALAGPSAQLAAAVFLSDPSSTPPAEPKGRTFNPSLVHKLKQNLWHAGVLAEPMHSSAGKSAEQYRPDQDVWELDRRGR